MDGLPPEIGEFVLVGVTVSGDELEIVTVRSPCPSVILVLEFSDRGVSQIGSRPNVSIRKSS